MQLDSDGEVISSGDESDGHSGSDEGEAFGGGGGAPLAPEARALQAGLLVARFEAAGAGGNDWVTSKLFCRTLAGWVVRAVRRPRGRDAEHHSPLVGPLRHRPAPGVGPDLDRVDGEKVLSLWQGVEHREAVQQDASAAAAAAEIILAAAAGLAAEHQDVVGPEVVAVVLRRRG